MMGAMVSPLRGADGNVEFLLHLRNGGTGTGTARPTDPASVVGPALLAARALADGA
jgi:hypothetical protein